MLAIAVNLNVDIIAKSLSILMPSLDRPADTKVLWEIQYVDIMLSAKPKCSVLRAVVNYDIVISSSFNRRNGIENAFLLVVSRNNYQNTRRSF